MAFFLADFFFRVVFFLAVLFLADFFFRVVFFLVVFFLADFFLAIFVLPSSSRGGRRLFRAAYDTAAKAALKNQVREISL